MAPSAALLLAAMGILSGCAGREALPYDVQSVPAATETAAMKGWGDRADDPAIWFNAVRPERSLLLGTNKAEGLFVYYLSGDEAQWLPVGSLNNVDLRDRIVVASNDEADALSWFRIDPNRGDPTIAHLGDTAVNRDDPYGVCLGVIGSRVLAGTTYRDGTIEFWQLDANLDDSLSATLRRTEKLGSQLEGCVFDDEEKRVFIGEEGVGIWSLDLADENSRPISMDSIDEGNGLVADVEGLALYSGKNGGGFLVASAQSADRFVVYDRLPPHGVRGAFKVVGNTDGSVDAVTHTDGIDVTSTPLPGFPKGVLIVQDDGNPIARFNQNFKVVDWREVVQALSLDR